MQTSTEMQATNKVVAVLRHAKREYFKTT